jgi:hypothetical protein
VSIPSSAGALRVVRSACVASSRERGLFGYSSSCLREEAMVYCF